MKHGHGEFRWATGGHYIGEYREDIKCGYGEMYWADGSIYRGTWERGIQNGLGIMIFSNGTRKAGVFKENVLVELLIENSTVSAFESQQKGSGFPETFKAELKEYIGLMSPKENNQQYLDKKYKDAKREEKTMPNTLMEMQDITNAPWQNGGMTRDDYVNFVKHQESMEMKNDFEPAKINIPQVANAEVQVDPPQS